MRVTDGLRVLQRGLPECIAAMNAAGADAAPVQEEVEPSNLYPQPSFSGARATIGP